jgi:hypothetical protein
MIQCGSGIAHSCARTPGPHTNQLVWASKTVRVKGEDVVIYNRICNACREQEQARERYRRSIEQQQRQGLEVCHEIIY